MGEAKIFSRGSHDIRDPFRTLFYKACFVKNNPRYFYPDGIWLFTGPQGSGKTLSAVQTVCNLAQEYPCARVVSNMDFSCTTEVESWTGYSDIERIDNGTNGVIFLVDEMHVLWNSLESKDIPFSEMAAFCQMRKARRIIVGTSQVYSRVAKPIREQLKYVWVCKNYLGLVQVNHICDPTTSVEREGRLTGGTDMGFSWFFHSPALYKKYETLNKIERTSRIGGAHFNGRCG